MALILVADDHRDTRELFAATLRGAGHEVVLAADGGEALTLFRGNRPDLLIIDIFMPGKDGIDAMLEIRRDFPEAKIIAVSAGWRVPNFELLNEPQSFDVLDHALTVGADYTMHKPIEVAQLVSAVDEVLRAPQRPRPR